jgi:hypothetical protein
MEELYSVIVVVLILNRLLFNKPNNCRVLETWQRKKKHFFTIRQKKFSFLNYVKALSAINEVCQPVENIAGLPLAAAARTQDPTRGAGHAQLVVQRAQHRRHLAVNKR